MTTCSLNSDKFEVFKASEAGHNISIPKNSNYYLAHINPIGSRVAGGGYYMQLWCQKNYYINIIIYLRSVRVVKLTELLLWFIGILHTAVSPKSTSLWL